MSAGRPPSPRTEAANQVLNAYDALEEEERRSQWKGVAWNSRFSYSKIRRQVEQNMPARIGDEPKRKAARADQTTRNGLKWLADGEHRYLVKEADGRYSRWSSVAGVLLSMESALSDVRLVLDDMRVAYNRCEPFLSTVPTAQANEGANKVIRALFLSKGMPVEELDRIDLNEKSEAELTELFKKLGAATVSVRKCEKAFSLEDVPRMLDSGWEFVAALNGSLAVLRSPQDRPVDALAQQPLRP